MLDTGVFLLDQIIEQLQRGSSLDNVAVAIGVFETLAGNPAHKRGLATAGNTTDQIAARLSFQSFGQTGFDILFFKRGGLFGERT